MMPISYDPTEAGLIGAAYLAPHRIFESKRRDPGRRCRRYQYPCRCGRA